MAVVRVPVLDQDDQLTLTAQAKAVAAGGARTDRIAWDITAHGVVADGRTETAAVQAAVDAAPAGARVLFPATPIGIDAPIVLRPGRIYESAGGTIRAANGSNMAGTAGVEGGITGLLVSQAWAQNAAFCDTPMIVRGFRLDGNVANNPSAKAAGIVMCNFWSEVDDLRVTGVYDGIVLTDVTADGTIISNSASENRIKQPKIYNTTRHGIYQICRNNASNQDGFLTGALISDTGGDGIHLTRAAGWMVDSPHLYGIGGTAIELQKTFGTRVRDPYIEEFGLAGQPGVYYAGLRVSQLDGYGTTISGGAISSTEAGAGAFYHYLSVNAGFGQSQAAVTATGAIARGAGAGTGLVLQDSGGGGSVTVRAAALLIDGMATRSFVAGSCVLSEPA